MRAAAVSCLCGIKAASISAAVREGELGIGWQRGDSSAHNSIHLLTGLEVVSWQRSEARSGGRTRNADAKLKADREKQDDTGQM